MSILNSYANCRPSRFAGRAIFLLLICWMTSSEARSETPSFSPSQLEFFEKKVRPLLSQHCYECHSNGAEKLQADLMVDSRSALLAGGDSGEAIVPGDPDSSLLIEALRWESYEMPPKGKLPDDEVAIFEKWIRLGAPWPAGEEPAERNDRPVFDLEQRAIDHWVWQPIQDPAAPEVKRSEWPRATLDKFILARLEASGLQPAGDADALAIFRRLHFDLTGLPPSPEQIEAYLADKSPGAIERVVDRLLASPQFGERWGRHWLDLVRYAESRGHEFDYDANNAYQYRDYIIRALNADVPHDQLVREHIAGDLLSEPRVHPEKAFNESILGTGFWFLGEWVHSPVDVRKDESDRFDNMIDVMSKAFLGVTVSCARCHDHKFDAISTADYYSLSGFLQSSDFRQVRFESMEQNKAVARELLVADSSFEQQVAELLARHQLVKRENGPLPKVITDRLVVDYGNIKHEDFTQNGYIFGDRPRRAGEPWLDTTGPTPRIRFASHASAVNDPLWNGLNSVMERTVKNQSKLVAIPRSGRTLRTPTFELTGEVVACVVHGQGHVVACVDSHRQIAGPLHGETIRPIEPGKQIVKLNLSRYQGHGVHLEFTPAKGQQLEIRLVLQGSPGQIANAIKALPDDANPAWEEFADEVNLKLGDELSQLADEWARERRQVGAKIVKRSNAAMAMLDGTPEDAHVLIRGNSSKLGEIEPRHFLTALSGNSPMEIQQGSGRLELAEHINDPANPLTTRVIVNRIWHYLMGRGIVATTDDFGVLGQRPTHPELLDHLATKFDQEGRSIKSMIRYIVLSRTYRMSSKTSSEAREKDPKNSLWSYRPPKRLEGEAIRDSLLAISGRLNAKQFGPPVRIHLTPYMKGRGRPEKSGPLDGDGRRSIYIAVRRNFLSPFMLNFDTPAPFSTMGRRTVSNVPAQALILMNDPFVAQQARGWATRALKLEKTPTERIQWMYLTGYARQPTKLELSVALEFVGDSADVERWTDLAHVLINTKEFIFIR